MQLHSVGIDLGKTTFHLVAPEVKKDIECPGSRSYLGIDTGIKRGKTGRH